MGREDKPKRSIFKKIMLFISMALFLTLAFTTVAIYKTGSVYVKISDSKHPIWDNILALLPVEKNSFASKLISDDSPLNNDTNRINIAILGMRGEDDPNGGLLADTIMIASILKEENKLALISIPRDLYIKVPHVGTMHKINFVYAYGQSQDQKGFEYMRETLQSVTGLDIHYAISVNFEAFKQTVDLLDGVTVHVPHEINETHQWHGQPFHMPEGDQKMDGETALLYARARYSTSDFDRARRQQELLVAIRNKSISSGTLVNPLKFNSFLDIVGANVKTDLSAWEIKKFVEIARQLELSTVEKQVFDSSPEGFLESKITDIGEFILVPRGSTYSQIQEKCKNIFN